MINKSSLSSISLSPSLSPLSAFTSGLPRALTNRFRLLVFPYHPYVCDTLQEAFLFIHICIYHSLTSTRSSCKSFQQLRDRTLAMNESLKVLSLLSFGKHGIPLTFFVFIIKNTTSFPISATCFITYRFEIQYIKVAFLHRFIPLHSVSHRFSKSIHGVHVFPLVPLNFRQNQC